MDTFEIILTVLAVSSVSALLSGLYFSFRVRQKVKYMLDALEDRETNFRFNETNIFHRRFNRTLNRLHVIFDRERAEIKEQEHFYGQMLDRVRTGIIVVDSAGKNSGRVVYCNSSALNIIGISSISHIRQLGNIDSGLEKAFKDISSSKEQRCSLYNERGMITVSITAEETILQGKQVRIIALNDITGDLAHNEELSWNRLIRVLTHEIMNTVTPISSLSRMLSDEVSSVKDSCSLNMNDLKTGLDTIADSSEGLIKFVDSYRLLTRISSPVKKPFYVREVIEKVYQLTKEQISGAGASFSYEEKSDDILLYADENQISQVIINLVRNALQADARHIDVSAEIDFAESVVIIVSNDGKPISEESRNQIFVPFYTTKQEGTGIGLSISRQIMRLHNGTITLVSSEPGKTVFSLNFR